jgi:hypothetical protein
MNQTTVLLLFHALMKSNSFSKNNNYIGPTILIKCKSVTLDCKEEKITIFIFKDDVVKYNVVCSVSEDDHSDYGAQIPFSSAQPKEPLSNLFT